MKTRDAGGYAGAECYAAELPFRLDIMSKCNAGRVMALNQFDGHLIRAKDITTPD